MRKIFTLLIVAILATATSWAAEKSIVINTANSGVTGSYSDKTFNVDGITFGFNQWMKNNNIQAKKSTQNSLYNKSAIPGKITRVVFKQTGTARAIKVFGGSNEKPTNAIASPETSGTMEFDFSGKGYTFFSMTTPSNAVYFSQITVYYEDGPGKTPTTLSWSAPTATMDLTSEVKEFPTLTKDPASITGITYTSSNADVATVNEATGEITLVACGQTTIKAAYAGDDTYASSSATYTLRVVDNSIAAGEYTIPLNNWFWATNHNGSFNVEKEKLKLQGQQNGISISLGNVNSTNAYVDDNETRTYSSYMMTVNAPEGYVLKKIEFVGTKWQSSTLNASAGNMGAQNIWSGNVSSVEFYFAGTCEIKNVEIAYEKAAPAKTLTSIAITGEPAQTEYTEGDAFSAEGLVVTATYDDASTAVVTDDATWSFEPATLAASTTSVTATATYNEKTASETYNVTVKEIPSYTYTWMVNGAEVKKSVLKEGTAVEAPANPENIDDKVFTGWVTTATVDANVVPTYATIDATAKANTTYYAVFATLKQGAGEKWKKKAASEITEEGVYALISKDGYAFNGEIESDGHGQSTADTFVFDKNDEATSAPEGTCELTFVKNGEGYKMYNKSTQNYLYSKKNASGNLDWNISESSFWSCTNGNWTYAKNKTLLRTFLVASTNSITFRTYGNNNGDVLYLAQKVAGAGYADFTTIVKVAEVTTLANLAVNGAEGTAYQVNDEMVVAKKFQAGNKNYIVVKDAAQAVRNLSAPTADDKSFNINGNKQEEYAQNNWMLVSLPVELYNQVNETNTVTSITGSLTEKFNVAMEATKVVFENATNNFAPNTYCPINFMGESSVKGTNPAYTSSYYFATPKANEYANVVWAVYNGTDGAFYLPVHQGSANAQEFKAAFKVDYSLNSVATPELVNGDMYSFEALVKEVAVATTDAKSAPRKTAYDSTVAPSTKFVVYPLDLDANKVATGVNDVNSAKEVKGVSYFNMMGVESAQPFDGVNIMVTTYTDGTSSAAKVLR
jgi:hypothetical protein